MADILQNFHFLRPYCLLVLIPALLLWLALLRKQDARTVWKRIIAPHLLDHLLVGRDQQARLRPIQLLIVVWILMGLSLAGPSCKKEPSPFAEDIAGMFVLLKVTPSMMAEDVRPSRLERAKQKLSDLLEYRKDGVTGLIVYSGSAHLVMPLTRDGRIINIMVEGLEPGTMPVEGDALAGALEMADKLFKQSGRVGSMLVIADTVSPGQTSKIKQEDREEGFPLQFLAVNALGTAMDKGLQEAADVLRAQITMLSVDASDVESVNRRSENEVKSILAERSGERWKDSGYALVPLILLVSLFWARRGWKV